MGWKEKLLPGSFRGASFLVESADGEIGRRYQVHEFPFRDTPYIEDMGKKPRRVSVEMYVLGADYMAARDALIEAFEKPGSGRLVHPYHGEMTVAATSVRGPRESTRYGGMARFTVTFVRDGERPGPTAETDTAAVVQEKADVSIDAIMAGYEKQFSLDGMPDYVYEHSDGLLGTVLDTLTDIKNAIPGVPDAVTEFVARLSAISSSVSAIIRTPADLAVEICGLVADIAGLTDKPARAINAYRSLWDALSDEPEISQTTASRTRQAENQEALAHLVQRAAIVGAVRTASDMAFDSVDAATALRDELCEEIEDELYTADDDTYAALSDLRAALVADIAARSADLARVIYYTPKATLPAIVIAHHLYDDPTRDEDIVARNAVRHPGFVPGGSALEVLTDG